MPKWSQEVYSDYIKFACASINDDSSTHYYALEDMCVPRVFKIPGT